MENNIKYNFTKEEKEYIKKNKITKEELNEAMKDSVFCDISLILAIEMNKEFRAQTKYFLSEDFETDKEY